jgi:hypothetical protein
MFVERTMTYAVGRGVEYTDMPTIRAIANAVAKENNRFSSIVLGVVRSPQFQMRVKGEDAAVTRTAATSNSQSPTPNSKPTPNFQLPTPKKLVVFGGWELGVGG